MAMIRPATTLQILIVLAISAATGIGLARHSTTLPADAEEKAVRVSLGYVRGYSNWGPTNVYGAAQIWPREAVANITVHNLPHLPYGRQYVWWVINMQTGAAMRLGAFNTTEAGNAFQDTYLAHALPAGANAVVVSIDQGVDRALRPGTQRTVGGYFAPPIASQATRPTGAGSAAEAIGSGGGTEANRWPFPRVEELPRTGGAAGRPR